MWGALSVLLVVGIGACLSSARAARSRAVNDAAEQAKLVAQTQLAPLLTGDDLEGPVTGFRYVELSTAIERDIVANGPVEQVTLWSSIARNLYDADQSRVGTRSSYLRQMMFEVANGDFRSDVVDDTLRTFVPIWIHPSGTVAVAEMDLTFGPIAARANAPWYRVAFVFAIALVVTLCLYALTFRPQGRIPSRAFAYEPARPVGLARDLAVPDDPAPVYMQPGFREVEVGRQVAEARAATAEENYRALQTEFKTMLDNVKVLEAKVSSYESRDSQVDGEVEALRAQVRDSADRIHALEVDGSAIRERLKLREQELEMVHAGMEEAEMKASQAERDLERAMTELENLESRFHMTKLSEALQEMDDVVVDAEEEAPTTTEPRVIFTDSGETIVRTGKVR